MSQQPITIVTGAASGIARHMTGVLAGMGHRIIATDINEEALKKGASEFGWDSSQVLLEKLDVRDAEQWKKIVDKAVKKWGRLDILMNIAGFAIQGFVHEFPLNHIDLHIDINAKGAILGTHFASVQMVKQGSGHIINMGSLAGLAPVPGTSLYCASKFALRGFSLAVSRELIPYGVHVTYVAPDLVDTPKLVTQLKFDEKAASVGFSAPKILTVKDIEKGLLKAMKKRPLEIAIPRHRGILCKIGSTFPGLASPLYSIMSKQGISSMAKERGKRVSQVKEDTPDTWVEKQAKK